MESWKRDTIFSLILILFTIICFFSSFQIKDPLFAQGLASSGTYLRIWLSLLMLLSLLLLRRALSKRLTNKKEQLFTIPVIFTITMLIIYAIIISILGYLLSTTIFLFITMSFYSFYPFKNINNEKMIITKRLVKYLFLSITMTFIIYYIFENFLNVIFPDSIFF